MQIPTQIYHVDFWHGTVYMYVCMYVCTWLYLQAESPQAPPGWCEMKGTVEERRNLGRQEEAERKEKNVEEFRKNN